MERLQRHLESSGHASSEHIDIVSSCIQRNDSHLAPAIGSTRGRISGCLDLLVLSTPDGICGADGLASPDWCPRARGRDCCICVSRPRDVYRDHGSDGHGGPPADTHRLQALGLRHLGES